MKKIDKTELEYNVHKLKLSPLDISEKYNIPFKSIEKILFNANVEILNQFGEKIPRTLSEFQKQLIYGTVLGNAEIIKNNKLKHGKLSIKHPIKEEGYLDFKENLLKDLIRTRSTIQNSEYNNKIKLCKSFKTLKHDFFSYVYSEFYDNNGNKKIENNNLIKKINDFGLSILYMDCGRPKKNIRDIVLNQYTFDDIILLEKIINEKFKLKCKTLSLKANKVIRIYSWSDFDKIIEPYIINSMRWKIQKK